jgi:CRISPR system Cascade subunit CasB
MSERTFDPQEAASAFLAHLRRLRDDRGALAKLRGALKPSLRHRAWPLLAAVGGIGRPIHETVAGLYAYHPDETSAGNLADTCRQLSGAHNSFDGRFRRLLSCDREELCARLAPVVLAAKAKGIPVNYHRLFCDLCYWSDHVKVEWARAFWGAGADTESATAETVEART